MLCSKPVNGIFSILFLMRSVFVFVLTFFMIFPATADERLLVAGEGSALGGMKLVASSYLNQKDTNNIMVLPSLGTDGALQALIDGKIHIAITSRPLRPREIAHGLVAREYARTPLVIVTRNDNKLDSVSMNRLSKFFSGEEKSWPDKSTVRVVRRPSFEKDYELLSRMSPSMKTAISRVHSRNRLMIAYNDQENADALEKLPGSLGVSTLAQVKSESRCLKPLKIDGMKASVDNLEFGDYPYYKSFYIVTRGQNTPLANEFLGFLTSYNGQQILRSHGHLTLEGNS